MNHNWDSQIYKNISSPQYVSGLKLLEHVDLSNINEILDLGCGNCKLTLEISKLIPDAKICGIDISQSMIQDARENIHLNNNITITHGNFLDITFNKNFDLVYSNKVLHWIVNQKHAFQKIHSILNVGGKIVASFGIKGSMPEFHEVCESLGINFELLNLKLSQSKEIVSVLKKIGFKINKNDVVWNKCKMKDRLHYQTFVEFVLLQGMYATQNYRHHIAVKISEAVSEYSFNFADITIIATKK